MTSFEIPELVLTIGENAFEGCSGLTSIDFPRRVSQVGEYAFSGCTGLTSIEIPDNVKGIGDSAFEGCSALTSVDIPDMISMLYNRTFASCDNLTTVMLPSNLQYMFTEVFAGSNGIRKVVYRGLVPAEITVDVFDSEVYENATLYVGSGLRDLFMTKYPWEFFDNITEEDNSGIGDIEADAADSIDFTAPTEVYTINGIRVTDNVGFLAAGIYIVRQGDTVRKITVK